MYDKEVSELQALIDALKIEARSNSVSPLRLASIHQRLLDLLRYPVSEAYIRKDRDDRTPYALSVGGDLTAEALLRSLSFLQGMAGWGVTQSGHAEFESADIRSFLRIYELIVNRQRTFDSDILVSEGDTVTAVRDLGLSTEGNPMFTLTLREEWDGYRTALYEADVLRGTFNDVSGSLDAPSGPGTSSKHEAVYFTSWLRVLAVRPADNEIDVVMYPDAETPAGRNFPPRPSLAVSRWGNAGETEAQKLRQRVIMISSSEARIVIYDHVTRPIITRSNIIFCSGRLPSFVADYDPSYREGDSGVYIQKLFSEQITYTPFAANPDPHLYYAGEYEQGRVYYDGTIRESPEFPWRKDYISYWGCLWLCNRYATQNLPAWDSADWILYAGDPRLQLEWDAPDAVVDIEAPDITLGVRALVNWQDITADPRVRWDWSRQSWNGGARDLLSDDAWTALHQNIGPSLHLLQADMNYAFGRPPEKLVYTVTATLTTPAAQQSRSLHIEI